MVAAVRETEQAIGRVCYELSAAEEKSKAFRRSLFVVEDVRAGELLGPHNVRSIRPGYGLPPRYLPMVLGRPASRDINKGTPLDWELIGGLS